MQQNNKKKNWQIPSLWCTSWIHFVFIVSETRVMIQWNRKKDEWAKVKCNGTKYCKSNEGTNQATDSENIEGVMNISNCGSNENSRYG